MDHHKHWLVEFLVMCLACIESTYTDTPVRRRIKLHLDLELDTVQEGWAESNFRFTVLLQDLNLMI
jgi:hypothetical protein